MKTNKLKHVFLEFISFICIRFHYWNKISKIEQKIQSNQRLLQSVSLRQLIKQAIDKYIMQIYICKLIDLL